MQPSVEISDCYYDQHFNERGDIISALVLVKFPVIFMLLIIEDFTVGSFYCFPSCRDCESCMLVQCLDGLSAALRFILILQIRLLCVRLTPSMRAGPLLLKIFVGGFVGPVRRPWCLCMDDGRSKNTYYTLGDLILSLQWQD